jgi:hypothetical protein
MIAGAAAHVRYAKRTPAPKKKKGSVGFIIVEMYTNKSLANPQKGAPWKCRNIE